MDNEQRQFIKMTTTPIPKLICSLALPTIISMLITSIYNLADTFFVSKLGTSAAGAVGIIMPLMAIIQSVGFTLGMGAGGVSSRLLGQRKNQEANIVFSTSFFTSLIAGLILSILGLTFLTPLINALGATDTIAPYATDYAKYILYNAPIMCSSFVMNNILRAEGKPIRSALGLGFGGLLNIILDPFFIFVCDMGISGAALATIISQIVSFIILLSNFVTDKTILKLNVKFVSFKRNVYHKIISTGIPSFYRQSLSSIATVALNIVAKGYGDAAVAAISIAGKLFMFIVSAMFGFGQGFQPVAGYNYGASKYIRLKEAFYFCVKIGVLFLTLLAVVSFIFAPQIMSMFTKDDAQVISLGALYLRLGVLTLPMQAVTILSNMLFQSTGQSKQASLIALSRQGLCFLPLILILPRLFGLNGILLSQPIADAVTFLICIIINIRFIKKLNEQIATQQKEGLIE